MTNPAEPSTPSGSSEKSTTKATDHELQKYDIFTRYGQYPLRSPTRPSMMLRRPRRAGAGIAATFQRAFIGSTKT
jgi:hypothetical protein